MSGNVIPIDRYTRVEAQILALLGLRLAHLYALLTFKCGANGSCWPSYATLADEIGVTPRHVQRMIHELRNLGLLTWTRGRGSNRYVVLPFHADSIATRRKCRHGANVHSRQDKMSTLDRTFCPTKRKTDKEKGKDAESSSSVHSCVLEEATTTIVPPVATPTKSLVEELPDLLAHQGKGALTQKQFAEVEAEISKLPEPEAEAAFFVREYLPSRIRKIAHAGALPTLAQEFRRVRFRQLERLKAVPPAAESVALTSDQMAWIREVLAHREDHPAIDIEVAETLMGMVSYG